MKRLLIFTGLILAIGMVNVSHAGFLDAFTGNTIFGKGIGLGGVADTPSGDSVINFAVYENTDGDWRDDDPFKVNDVLINLSAFDGDADFVYFYQLVNADPNTGGETDEKINSFFVPIFSSSNSTSAGGLDLFVFNESGGAGATGPTTNKQLGTNTVSSGSANGDTPGDGSPTQTGDFLAAEAFVAISSLSASDQALSENAKQPQSADIAHPFFPGLTRSIKYAWDVGEEVDEDEYSQILLFTSNERPSYNPGIVSDGDDTYGDIPTPTPAPAGLVLLLTGIPGIAGFGWYQKRRKNVATV